MHVNKVTASGFGERHYSWAGVLVSVLFSSFSVIGWVIRGQRPVDWVGFCFSSVELRHGFSLTNWTFTKGTGKRGKGGPGSGH